MKKAIFFLFIIGFSISGHSQNLQSEYQYLALVKTQTKKLIKDNLRNAELISDELIYSKSENKKMTALFFMELGDNYNLVDQPEFAIYSYLRQRFLFPNDSISLYVEKQIRIIGLALNIDKQLLDYLIQKSAPHHVSKNKETNLNNLIYWSSRIETKKLTDELLHQLDLMNSVGINQVDYLLKWEDLSRINIPLKYKMDYLEQDFNSLSPDKKILYYKQQTKYYIKLDAWAQAENSFTKLKNLKPENNSGFSCLKLRIRWHF